MGARLRSSYAVWVLSQRELELLAQIEAHLRTDDARLARVLARGSRWALLSRPEPGALRASLLVALMVFTGVAMLLIGVFTGNVAILAVALPTVIVLPLPVWLAATSPRFARIAVRQVA